TNNRRMLALNTLDKSARLIFFIVDFK
ncbi:hypothetical protein TNCT_12271, partial [Trichonephila clavata]